MSKKTRRWIWLAVFAPACGVYLWLFGIQTVLALEARNIGRKAPIVKSIPVELEDLSISQAPGEKVSFLGAELEVPWHDIDEAKTRITGNWVAIQFRSGLGMIVCVSSPNGFIADMSKDEATDPALFASIYGQDVLRSDYALKRAIFETTPSKITLRTPANRAAGLSEVIVLKAIMPPTNDWAIFKIRSKEFRGFQLGSPLRRPKRMSLELFGDDVEFEINFFQNASRTAPGITQAEINRIIQTAHRTAHAQPVFTVSPV